MKRELMPDIQTSKSAKLFQGKNFNRIQELDVYLKLESIFINKILETY